MLAPYVLANLRCRAFDGIGTFIGMIKHNSEADQGATALGDLPTLISV